LLPLFILIGTGLRGLDFGLHWDERPWQIGPVKSMVESRTLLPGYYNYPSFDYCLNLLILAPDVATPRISRERLDEHLIRTLDSHAYLMRLRAIYLVITSLTLVWVYLLVLEHRGSWLEALFAASVVACSWEVAYHLRWVATDGMLMQFAALTVLLAAQALKSRYQPWLIAAAAVAGLGFGTKYPGGLLVLPVMLAGLFGAVGCTPREKAGRLVKVAAIFVLVYLAVTPATVLQPTKLAHAVFFEMSHYAVGGHAGHAVGRGFEHAWRMLAYFSTVSLSPYLPIALLMFALAIIGIVSVMRRNPREGAVLLVFPLFYLLYFSMQRAMVVRNLLAVIPFLGAAAARGAGVISGFLGGNRSAPAVQLGRTAWRPAVWAALLGVLLCFNAWWLIASAESIVARHTDRFVREAAEYIREHTDTKFLLSPRVTRDVAMVAPPLGNLTVDPAEADVFVLYAREGMRRWHDWPANRRGLTQACFGPREVNFDMYPNWWGDDHIVAINRRRAEEISLHIAGISQDPGTPETVLFRPATQAAASPSAISADSLPSLWWLPGVDPRILVPRADAEAIAGPIVRGPASGGWELDGKASTYLTRDGLVISVAFISTSAFNLERHDPQSAILSDVGASAYAARTGPLGDIRLFARSFESAVVIHISGDTEPKEKRLVLAKQFARTALDHLDIALDSGTPSEPRR
jgi:hypothetical protein